MRIFVAAASLVLLMPVLASAEESKQLVVKLQSLTDVEKTCIDQAKSAWQQPGVSDDTQKLLTVDQVFHRKENQGTLVVFYGKVHNEFLQVDREATVTCRVNDKAANVSFQIDR